ncbi:MAG: serine hydrolase domain-containing protein [Pseudomonadota bacterium]
MTRISIALSGFMFLACPVVVDAVEPADIDQLFVRYSTGDSPGCSVGVYQSGEIVFSKGYGFANIEHRIPNSATTKFRIASVSKQFAAAAIALLAEDGKLSIEDDVRKYFPDLPDYGTTITIAHLVYHTSGIRDYLDLGDLAEWGDAYSTDQALAMIARQKAVNFEPGSQYAYSNSGYIMLGRIVEIVTGQTLDDWSQENMFKPLEMHDTYWHANHSNIVSNRAYGYSRLEGGNYRTSLTTLDIAGDGALMTTIEDLLLWDNNFYSNQLGKGDQSLVNLMETPGGFSNGDIGDYGFGLSIDNFAGTPEIWHSGGWYGVSTSMHRYPEHQLGVVVLCNDDWARSTTMARDIAALYMGLDLPTLSNVDNVPTVLREIGESASEISAADTALFDELVGSYYSAELDYTLRLDVEDGRLRALRRSGPEYIEKMNSNLFTYRGYLIVIERDEHDAVSAITLNSDWAKGLRFIRK